MALAPYVDKELWLSIGAYDGRYDVSDMGRVRSWVMTEPRLIKPVPNDRGYHVVTLSNSQGIRRQHKVHHLVLEAFVGPRPDGYQGAHEDDNKEDNRLVNLAWKSRADNIRDRHRNGGTARGGRHGAYKHGKFVGRARSDAPKFIR